MRHLDLTDPWIVREPSLDLDALGATESVFALSNGYLGVRGTLDEVDPGHAPGTFLAGVYETHPMSYPEGGYGYPQEGEAIIAVADGAGIRVEVDGVPLDVRAHPPQRHERALDLRSGVLDRDAVFAVGASGGAGGPVRLTSRRVVSLVDRSVSAVRHELTALEAPVRVVVRSGLVVNASPSEVDISDPRVEEALDAPFEAIGPGRLVDGGGVLVHRTRRSGIAVAAAVGHDVEVVRARQDDRTTGDRAAGHIDHAVVDTQLETDRISTTITVDLGPGDRLVTTKFVTHMRAVPGAVAATPATTPEALCEHALAALEGRRARGWDALLAAQRTHLDEFWSECGIDIDGDDELRLALRYVLFQVHTAAACIVDAPLGAKGLTGSGYGGHTFWDIEGFVLPALTLLRPDSAARLLRWRSAKAEEAHERARVLDLAGASFPWRTISGREVSSYWPASTAAMHVNADVARAFDHYVNATGEPLAAVGCLGVFVGTARLWASFVATDAHGGCHVHGVTGPDEYTGVVDDNLFTNLMAQRNLRIAADACAEHPEDAAGLGVTDDEVARWRRVADDMHVPYDDVREVHPQNTGFTDYREWPFEERRDDYPVQEHAHYAVFYRSQVLKQADVVQAMWWCRDAFTPEQVARNLEYYEARTVRDSSLSAATQAVVCAQADHVDLALRYLREAALVDLRDLQDNADLGLHLASAAGAWFAFTAGLGGLREDHDTLELAPHLPSSLTRTLYHVRWRGTVVRVETTRDGTTLSVPGGEGAAGEPAAVDVVIDGRPVIVTADEPVTVPLREPAPLRAEPTQPPGCAPQA